MRNLFEKYFSETKEWRNTELTEPLHQIVRIIRPKRGDVYDFLTPLIETLKSNELYLKNFREYMSAVFTKRSFTEMIIDVGIISDESFRKEFTRKITDNILPDASDPNNLRYVLRQVFYKKNDYEWIYRISYEQQIELIRLLNFKPVEESFESNGVLWQVYWALEVLALRASGAALEKNIMRLTPQFHSKLSPFLALFKEIESMWDAAVLNRKLSFVNEGDYKQILVLIHQCRDYLRQAQKNSEKFGISLTTNKDIYRIEEQLDRIELLIPLLVRDKDEVPEMKLIHLFYKLMEIHSRQKKLTDFISDSTQMLALEISSHKAKTGEKYISHDKRGYGEMLYAALGGGLIVGFLCIIKLYISKLNLSDFGFALLYSMNYSIGFIVIYLFGFTLATKQPAMTANTLAILINQGMNSDLRPGFRFKEFARYFAQLFRTQFIAFVGNVAMAFPVALLGVYLIYVYTSQDIAEEKYLVLLKDLSPVHSPALFHAAIAGFFLFLSGIISGSIANQIKFFNIHKRLEHNPALKLALGTKNTKKLSEWYAKKWPGIMSNFWFGIFLGSTGSLGAFLGLNIDIRHITFAAGNLGMAFFGANWDVPLTLVLWSSIGVALIGFVNFIVSFALSLLLAFKSRGIHIRELRPVLLSILHEFKSKPMSFFFPVGLNHENTENSAEGI
ncbi:MAG: recombinase [Flavobacteriaceae bacterium]|nr:recombinase [Flavobacteriaceae bacterium]